MARSKKTVAVETPPAQESLPQTAPIPHVRVTWRDWGAWAIPVGGGDRVRLSPDISYELVDESHTEIALHDPASGKIVTLRKGMVEKV